MDCRGMKYVIVFLCVFINAHGQDGGVRESYHIANDTSSDLLTNKISGETPAREPTVPIGETPIVKPVTESTINTSMPIAANLFKQLSKNATRIPNTDIIDASHFLTGRTPINSTTNKTPIIASATHYVADDSDLKTTKETPTTSKDSLSSNYVADDTGVKKTTPRDESQTSTNPPKDFVATHYQTDDHDLKNTTTPSAVDITTKSPNRITSESDDLTKPDATEYGEGLIDKRISTTSPKSDPLSHPIQNNGATAQLTSTTNLSRNTTLTPNILGGPSNLKVTTFSKSDGTSNSTVSASDSNDELGNSTSIKTSSSGTLNNLTLTTYMAQGFKNRLTATSTLSGTSNNSTTVTSTKIENNSKITTSIKTGKTSNLMLSTSSSTLTDQINNSTVQELLRNTQQAFNQLQQLLQSGQINNVLAF